MAELTDPFLEVKWGYSEGEDGWGPSLNADLIKFAFFHNRRLDGSVSSLPPTPADGEAYFNTTDQRVYYRANSTWYSSPVPLGTDFTIKGTEEEVYYNGTATLSPLSPDDTLELKLSGNTKAIAVTTGIGVRGALNNAPTTPLSAQDANVQLQNTGGGAAANLGFTQSSSTLRLENLQWSGVTRASGKDASGNVVDYFTGDPVTGDFALNFQGVEVVRTLAAASGGLEVNNTLTGSGFERVATASEIASSVDGPGSSTDNAIPRFDGSTGRLIQDSGVLIDDSDNITGADTITAATVNATANLQEAGTDLSAKYAQLAVPNFFTEGQAVQNTNPNFVLSNTDSAVGEGNYFIGAGVSDFYISTNTDAFLPAETILSAVRSGTSVTNVSLPNGDVSIGNNLSVTGQIDFGSGDGRLRLDTGVVTLDTIDELAPSALAIKAGDTTETGSNVIGSSLSITAGSGFRVGGPAHLGKGGDVIITGGGQLGAGRGGDVVLTTGAASGGIGGSGSLRAASDDGNASATSVAGGPSGVVSIKSGGGGSNTGGASGGPGGVSGAFSLFTGEGGNTNSTGAHNGGSAGTLSISSGSGGDATAGTGNGGDAGDITVTLGLGGTSVGGTAGADGKLSVVQNAVTLLETTDAASGGLLVNNQSTGVGLERVLTTGDLGGISGDVSGPSSATDNAIARFDGTSGKLVQNSVVTIDDTGIASGFAQLNVDDIRLDANIVSVTSLNSDLVLQANGVGDITLKDPASNSVVVSFKDSTDTLLGSLQSTSSGVFLRNVVNGQPVTIHANDAGGVDRSLIVADPDTGVDFPTGALSTQGNTVLASTDLAANGGTVPETDRQNIFTENQEIKRDNFTQLSLGSYRDAASTHTQILAIAARGTEAAPSDISAGDSIFSIESRARSGGALLTGRRLQSIYRSDSDISWELNGGGFVVGSPTSGSQGAGTINAEDVLVNGKSVRPILVRKDGSTSRSSTTTLADDPHLSATLELNTTYLVEMVLHFDAPAAGGFKFSPLVPDSGTLSGSPNNLRFTYVEADNGGTQGFTSASGSLSDSAGNWTTVVYPINDLIANNRPVVLHLTGYITTGGSATTFTLEWAQNTSHATNTTLRLGSFMRFTPE